MATGNARKHEVVEASTNQDSHLISTSRRIQDLADMYINPEESFIDAESAILQNDLNSETPNKYPNAPHPSPIDLQNETNSSVFNDELVKCLNKLPMILLALEENTKDSAEILEIDTDYPPRSYFEASTCTGSNLKSVIASSHLAWAGDSESAKSANLNNQLESFKFLGIDSLGEFSTDFYRTSTLCDNTSIIVNCSDTTDISFEDLESASSDDDSSCASRDRIQFEALALESTRHPSTFQRFQPWRTRGRNKRALSLDEVNPSKLLHTNDFSTTLLELSF